MSVVISKMTSVRQSGYGTAPSVLSIDDVHAPALTATQVLVRVHAASINRLDSQQITGQCAYVRPVSFPRTPGYDVAGIVVAVGSRCERITIGDAVYGTTGVTGGAFAAFVSVEESLLDVKPFGIDLERCASAPFCAQTSLSAFQAAGLRAGDKVMIIGASGGTGSFAIQIAKALGASAVTAVCASDDADYCAQLGADEIIDYFSVNWSEVSGGKHYNIILDCVGGAEQWQNAHHNSGVLADGGTFITLVGDDKDAMTTFTTVATQLVSNVTRQFFSNVGTQHHYIVHQAHFNRLTLETVTDLIKRKIIRLDTIVERVYDFSIEGVLDMFARNASQRTRGKLLLNVLPQCTDWEA